MSIRLCAAGDLPGSVRRRGPRTRRPSGAGKCRACRNDLLSVADPGRPSPAAAAHLAGCPACQEWQRRLLVIEKDVARALIPPPRAREAFLQRLLEEAAPPVT